MSFRSEQRPARRHCVTLRISDEQNALLDHLAEHLELSKGEVLRTALDYWLEHSPEARKAQRTLPRK